MNWIFDWIFDWIDDHLGLVTILVGGALAICIGLMVWAAITGTPPQWTCPKCGYVTTRPTEYVPLYIPMFIPGR